MARKQQPLKFKQHKSGVRWLCRLTADGIEDTSYWPLSYSNQTQAQNMLMKLSYLEIQCYMGIQRPYHIYLRDANEMDKANEILQLNKI